LSSAKPGNSVHATGTHLLFPVEIDGPDGAGAGVTVPGPAGRETSSAGGSGTEAQPASVPTIASHAKVRAMLVILLEALLALVLLVFIVWWTMFSGRKGGEPPSDGDTDEKDH
jgi:hypothetical protein